MAAAHCRVCEELRGVAEPAEPVTGSHAAVQPEIYFWGQNAHISLSTIF